eukprot:m.72065 g.72065  ORF g.72065 m.72065 type:complete len:85 (+) comp12300_c0_seq6:424-678(+)
MLSCYNSIPRLSWITYQSWQIVPTPISWIWLNSRLNITTLLTQCISERALIVLALSVGMYLQQPRAFQTYNLIQLSKAEVDALQ